MNRLEQYFERIPFNKDIRFDKREIPSLPAGFKPTILGEPRWGMVGQYRCGLLHAYDFGSHWVIHKDKRNPETHPIEHLVEDASQWFLFGALAAGVIAGAVIDHITHDPE